MADILPQWVAMCHHGILSQPKLPRETELCPLFVLFRNYVEDPEKTVTWALTFAMHAMLTSIIETDRMFDAIVDISKTTFNHFEA